MFLSVLLRIIYVIPVHFYYALQQLAYPEMMVVAVESA
jgi:hypothetical protein